MTAPPDDTTGRADQAEQSAMDRLTRLGLMTASSRHLVEAMLTARDEELERLRTALAATRSDVDAMQREVHRHVLANAEQQAEVERLRAELALQQREFAQLGELYVHACRGASERKSLRQRAEKAEAERDLLRETLAETDLGALTLAQWEAIAAADADRDRLEAERDALKAAIAGKAIVEKEHLAEILVYVFGDDDVAVVSAPARDGLLASLKATLDAPETPDRPKLITGNGMKRRPSEELTPIHEDPDGAYVDRHGRSWDRHPFVQGRFTGNGVCMCGQPPESQIHAPEAPGDAEEATGRA